MGNYIGLDVSLKETSICVIDANGEVLARITALTNPASIAKAIHPFQNVELIGLESGGMSHFHTAELRKLVTWAPIVCVDALHLSGFLNMNTNKTDKHDAEGIAQALRCNIYKEVIIKTEEQLQTRSLLTSRNALVKACHNLRNTLRGTLKTMGYVLPLNDGESFEKALSTYLDKLHGDAKDGVLALVRMISAIESEINTLDHKLVQIAKMDKRCAQLQRIPGVGPIVALSYLTDVGDPRRFKDPSCVGAYFGLTSRKYSSGETDIDRGISKRGPKGTRTLLVTAAKAMLRSHSWCSIKAWGVSKSKKKTYKQVVTAMARKLAETMLCMLLTGEDFRFSDRPQESEEKNGKKKRSRPATRSSKKKQPSGDKKNTVSANGKESKVAA